MSSQITVSTKALARIEDVSAFVHSGSIYLFQGPRSGLRAVMENMGERFALREKVRIIAGGNWVSFDRLPFLLKERQGRVYEVLDRIFVSRAETCYQMVDVLNALKPSSTPLLVLDLLDPFDDEDLTDMETNMLLDKCILRLGELSEAAPVLISISQSSPRANLISKLETIADMRIYLEQAQPSAQAQMEMF
jgi:hypothetical protein